MTAKSIVTRLVALHGGNPRDRSASIKGDHEELRWRADTNGTNQGGIMTIGQQFLYDRLLEGGRLDATGCPGQRSIR